MAASKTFTRQPRLMGASGSHGTQEGDGMSTREVYDWPTDLNNMWGYAALRFGYCQGQSGDSTTGPAGYVSVGVSGASATEIFIAQVPTIVPPGAARLAWTLGTNLTADAGTTTSVDAYNLYLSGRRYTGPASFDVTQLSPDYTKRQLSVSESVSGGGGGATSSYVLHDDGSPGMVAPLCRRPAIFDTDDGGAFLVLTSIVTAEGVELGNALRVHDFTWWFLPE